LFSFAAVQDQDRDRVEVNHAAAEPARRRKIIAGPRRLNRKPPTTAPRIYQQPDTIQHRRRDNPMASLLQSTAVLKTFTFPAAGHTISIQLSKAGGTYGNPSVGASNLTDATGGTYTFQLSATDTNTLGLLTYSLVDGGNQVAPLTGDIEDLVVSSLAKTKDLITLDRAKQDLPVTNDKNALVATLLTACSDAIAKYCRRDFVAKTYDELYNGTGTPKLFLREYPIQSVTWVRYRPVTVIKIINNQTTVNQQARVQITSTGLTLTRVASGVTTTNTITFASNVTINTLATAINALAGGWSAQIVGDDGSGGGTGDYGLWPSADLWVAPSFGDGLTSQGNLTARGQNAEVKMHTYELAGYQFDHRGWLLRAIPYTDPELQHPEDLVWPIGVNNFRIKYTAGYTTIPESVQEACAQWVAMLYYLTLRDPTIVQQSSAPAGGTATSTSYGPILGAPPPRVAALLAPYRRHIP
jgi:hypothetical protein